MLQIQWSVYPRLWTKC